MAPSYDAKASSNQNQRVLFFSCLGQFSIISSGLGKVKVYPVILPCQS